MEAFSALSYAADRSGVDSLNLAGSLAKMQRTVAAAAGGSKSAAGALVAMGASVQDLAGMRPEEQFKYLADRIAAIENPTQKAAAADGRVRQVRHGLAATCSATGRPGWTGLRSGHASWA